MDSDSAGSNEAEDEDVGDDIAHPFDPTKVRVEPKPITIDALCSRIKHNEINLRPEYQRFANIWTEEAKSRLIESLLIRIPLPAFYVDATNDDEWQVIDGLQRMTALRQFVVDQSMKLKKLEFLTDVEGCTFSMLHRKLQRRILETQVTLFAVQPGTPNDVKFNIFKRVNTGGRPLTPQEIRHALYQGQATKLLEIISENDSYKSSPATLNPTRMADREMILRYFAYIFHDPYTLQRESLDARLNRTMEFLNVATDLRLAGLQGRFFVSLKIITSIFGDMAFRRPGQKMNKRKSPPMNKPLFEAWMVNISNLDNHSASILVEKKEELKMLFESLSSNQEFMLAIHQGTGMPSAVMKRFECIRDIIKVVCND